MARGKKPSKGPRLTDEDRDSWARVIATATPLSRRPISKPPLPKRDEDSSGTSVPSFPIQRNGIGLSSGTQRPVKPLALGPTLKIDRMPDVAETLAAHPLRMDSKVFGRLKRGKMRPQRKIDLHGMTLSQAHPALIRFIHKAHADGLRLVIVVTGKGNTTRDDPGPIPVPRGLLRHHVPGWLHAMPLRPLVLQVTPAHLRHGGEGAYYVYLTRGG